MDILTLKGVIIDAELERDKCLDIAKLYKESWKKCLGPKSRALNKKLYLRKMAEVYTLNAKLGALYQQLKEMA